MPRLHIATSGRGEPLLCIPGFGVASRMYEPIVARYSERFEVIRFDPLGSGRSSGYWASPSVPHLAADAVRVLDELGLQTAHVLGLSLGGLVAQELALRFPHRVRGLMLVSTGPSGPLATPPHPGRLARVSARAVHDSVRQRRFALGATLYDAANVEDRVFERALPWTLVAHLTAFSTHDRERHLHRIQAPTLVLHGGRDALVSAHNARRLARRIPRAELHVIEDAGHGLLLEREAEVYRTITAWLDRTGAIIPPPSPGVTAVRREQLTRLGAIPLGTLRVQANAVALTLGAARPRRS